MKRSVEADAVGVATAVARRSLQPPTIAALVGGLRQQWPLIVLSSLLGLGAATAYVLSKPLAYTATSAISTEQQRVRVIQDAYTFSGEDSGYETDAGTQVELVRSTKVASIVAETQGLVAKRVETASADQPRLKQVLANLGLATLAERVSPAPVETAVEERLINDLKAGLSVRRVPRTAIIEVSYTSGSPEAATRLANAFSEAYIEYSRRQQREASKSAATWLRERLAELKETVQETEQSIQKFKERRGFVATDGRLIEETRLAEANRQLAAAQAETSNARVRFAKLQSAAKAVTVDGVPAEFLSDPMISQLRNRHLQVDMSERSLSTKLGAGHDAVSRLRQQRLEVERQLRSELERIAGSMRGQIELAQAREEAIRREYQELARLNTQSSEAQIELRELERRNEAYKSLYSTILQKYQSAINQQTLTEVPARIINRALTPAASSGPSPVRVLSFGLLLGAALGTGLAAARILTSNTLRTRQEAISRLGVERAWLLPAAPTDRLLVADEAGADGERRVRPGLAAYVYGQRHPNSYFSGTLDAIRLEIANHYSDRTPKVGIVALVDDLSSSIVAKNLASLTAATGSRTLLIDADLANASLSRTAAPGALAGLTAAVLKMAPVGDLVFVEADTGLRLLPAVSGESARRPADLLSSAGFQALLDEQAAANDFIVIDMPPVGLGVEAQALLPQLDAVVLVIAWSQTTTDIVTDALDHTPGLAEKCIGVVMLGADTRVAQQFGETDVRSSGGRRMT